MSRGETRQTRDRRGRGNNHKARHQTSRRGRGCDYAAYIMLSRGEASVSRHTSLTLINLQYILLSLCIISTSWLQLHSLCINLTSSNVLMSKLLYESRLHSTALDSISLL